LTSGVVFLLVDEARKAPLGVQALLVIGAAALWGLLVVIVASWIRPTVPKTPEIPTEAPSQPRPPVISDSEAESQMEIQRLLAIADADERELPHRLFNREESYAKAYFAGTEPYLEIHVNLINASVFDVRVAGQVEGSMGWRTHPFSAQARAPQQIIPHAAWAEVVVRQHVSPETAKEIDKSGEEAWIDIINFTLSFTYERGGQTRRFQLGVGAARVRVRR
jgi:hypothetical protein